MEHTVFVIGLCDVVSLFLHDGLCVCHSDAKPCSLYHGYVVIAVPAAYHLVRRQADGSQETDAL